MTDVTTPDDGFEPDIEEVADDQVDDQVNDQADDAEDGEEGSQDDELEDFEEDGKTYKVHKDLKGHLLRNADYTRKTQEIADQRKALESERVKVRETNEAIEDTSFQLKAVQSRTKDLQQLTEADWSMIRQLDARDGTDNYGKLTREYQALPIKEADLKRTLDDKRGEVAKAQQEITAKRVSEGQAVLQRDIPGWGPELGAKLVDFVKSEYGVTEESHSDAFMDPAIVKLAYAAFKAKESDRKTTTQKRAADIQKLQPVPQARGSSVPKTGLHDNLSTAEWIKRDRELQARKNAPAPRRA